jgi:ribosomal protein L32
MSGFSVYEFCTTCGKKKRRMPFDDPSWRLGSSVCSNCGDATRGEMITAQPKGVFKVRYYDTEGNEVNVCR